MASVTLRSNESQDSLLKRFRKKVVKSGVLSTVRRKQEGCSTFFPEEALRKVAS